jgi:hypothetical protein
MTSRWARSERGMSNMRPVARILLLLVVVVTTACASTPRTAGDELELLRGTIAKVVDDAERESAMLEAVDQMHASVDELGDLVIRDRDGLLELLRDPATPRAKIEVFVAEHLEEREEILLRLADAHFEFKELAEPDEWKKLAKSEKNALTLVALRSLGEAALVE